MKKTIMYLSRSTEGSPSGGLPAGMASVVVQSRVNNRTADISAFLCFHQGVFLQILEGESGAVDGLYGKICGDGRHADVVTLLDKPVEQTFFAGHHFKLASVYQEASELVDYVNFHLEGHYHRGISIQKVFDDLREHHSKPAESEPTAEDGPFAGKAVLLKRWPRFDLVSPTRETLELCARIAKSPMPHAQLCLENPFPSRSALDDALFRLNEMDLLELSAAVDQPGEPSARGGFFQTMKDFINKVAA